MATASNTKIKTSGVSGARASKASSQSTLTAKTRAEANLTNKKATATVKPAKTLAERRAGAKQEAEVIRGQIAKKNAEKAAPALAPTPAKTAKPKASKAATNKEVTGIVTEQLKAAAKPAGTLPVADVTAALDKLPVFDASAAVPIPGPTALRSPNITLPDLASREAGELDRRSRIAAKMAARAQAGVDPEIAAVHAVGEMHKPRQIPKDLNPVATDPSAFTADIGQITRSAPSLLYSASVMRPSLALAQGHALSLLQGLVVQVHEFTVAPDQPRFSEEMADLVAHLHAEAVAKGFVCSVEAGYNRAKGRNDIATLRLLVRKGELALMVVMFSGSTIMVHDMGGFDEGRFAIEKFSKEYEPREKGYIHHLAFVDGKVSSSRYENNDDGRFHDEAYPFIFDELGGANDFVDRYNRSDSSILNLYGLAGSGKSTLMRKIATRATGRTSMLVDNPMFYQDPNAAAALIHHIRSLYADGQRPFVMLEEADEFLRQKDNAFLPQLLSMTSGVLTVDVKIVIATNLSTIDHMVAAMQRSGRSFGNIEFHRMTRDQAIACRRAFKMSDELPFEAAEYSLADVLTTNVVNIGSNKRKLGFSA